MFGPRQNKHRARLFARYFLPGIVFQSVVIGGGYASGREIVEFGGRHGVLGLWSVVGILGGFTILAVLTYEFARIVGAYNYRSFMRQLVGPFWLLFDLLYLAFSILVLAVVSSAAGTVVEATVGLPSSVTLAAVGLLMASLLFYGRELIERVKTLGTVLLYTGYAVLTAAVLVPRWPLLGELLTHYKSGLFFTAPAGQALLSGLLYVGYNSPLMVITLFVLDRQNKRRETVWSGIFTGLMAAIPFAMTYLALMSFYPDPAVMGAHVPWLEMLNRTGAGGLLFLYSTVFFYTLVETGTGLIHSLQMRLDDTLAETGRPPLTARQRAGATAAMVAAAALLSRLGLIPLIAQGYTAMSYGFLFIFVLPLLTVGTFRICSHWLRQG